MLLTILIIIVGVFAVIGLIVGLVKGVHKVKTWAMEILCATALTIPASKLYAFSADWLNSVAVIVTAVGSLLAFMVLSAIIKNVFRRRWRPLGRIFGGIALAVKGASIACIVLLPILAVIELINIEAINSIFSSVFEAQVWISAKPYILDYLLLALTSFLLREGYKTGIAGALWAIIKILLFLGAAYLAYVLVFNGETLSSAAEALAANVSFISSLGETASAMSESLNAVFFAKCILTAGMCILLWIVVALINFIGNRVLDNMREGEMFIVVDGVFGAIVLTVLIFAIIMVIGGLLGSMADLEFMAGLNSYAANGTLASSFYDNSPIMAIEFFRNLDVASYFGG